MNVINVFQFEIIIIPSNHCFETWLLGKRGIYPSVVESDSFFYPYYAHYNIDENDPELMIPPNNVPDTIAKYHFHYLHDMLRYRHLRYRKSNPPQFIKDSSYINDLVNRATTTNHLQSFRTLYEFIQGENNLQNCNVF